MDDFGLISSESFLRGWVVDCRPGNGLQPGVLLQCFLEGFCLQDFGQPLPLQLIHHMNGEEIVPFRLDLPVTDPEIL